MWRKMLVVAAAGLLIAADEPKKEPPGTKSKLEGTWNVVSMEMRGKKDDPPAGAQLIFEGDKFTMKMGGRDVKATFKIDASKSPAQMDVLVAKDADGPFKGKTALGIYAIEGDTLKWCSSEPGEEARPKEFASKEDSKAMFMTLKRDKK